MMTANVARLFGLNKGVLKAGADADVVVFDQDVNLKAVFVMGKKEA
jgi:N-acetylglucosamine-6-phosphate deacetylase